MKRFSVDWYKYQIHKMDTWIENCLQAYPNYLENKNEKEALTHTLHLINLRNYCIDRLLIKEFTQPEMA